MTLTEFLLARIAEDEAVAREAGAVQVPVGGGKILTGLTYRESVSWEISVNQDSEYGETGSVEVHPARVLAECEAKRRIVADAAVAESMIEGEWSATYGENPGWRILAALALPYADHPDCREEWKP